MSFRLLASGLLSIDGCAPSLRLRAIALALRVGLAFAAAHARSLRYTAFFEAARYRACAPRAASLHLAGTPRLLFHPLRIHQKQFVTDDSVELVRAGRILGKAAHAFAVATFARIQGLRRFKTFLGFSQPVHLQAQQSELVMSLTKLRIQFRGLSEMLDGAFMLSRAVVNRANQKVHWRAGLQLECGMEMFDGLLSLPARGEERTKQCMSCR